MHRTVRPGGFEETAQEGLVSIPVLGLHRDQSEHAFWHLQPDLHVLQMRACVVAETQLNARQGERGHFGQRFRDGPPELLQVQLNLFQVPVATARVRLQSRRGLQLEVLQNLVQGPGP
jgi:hypothetical protein